MDGFGLRKRDRLRRLGKRYGWADQWIKHLHPRRTRDGRQKGHEHLVLIGDGQAAIHAVPEINACPDVTAAVRGRWELQGLAVERDGMVVGDAALIVKAEQAVQIAAVRQRLTSRAGLLGGDREALVVLDQIGGEHVVGLLQRAGMRLAEFLDKAILERAPQLLNFALGLHRGLHPKRTVRLKLSG